MSVKAIDVTKETFEFPDLLIANIGPDSEYRDVAPLLNLALTVAAQSSLDPGLVTSRQPDVDHVVSWHWLDSLWDSSSDRGHTSHEYAPAPSPPDPSEPARNSSGLDEVEKLE